MLLKQHIPGKNLNPVRLVNRNERRERTHIGTPANYPLVGLPSLLNARARHSSSRQIVSKPEVGSSHEDQEQCGDPEHPGKTQVPADIGGGSSHGSDHERILVTVTLGQILLNRVPHLTLAVRVNIKLRPVKEFHPLPCQHIIIVGMWRLGDDHHVIGPAPRVLPRDPWDIRGMSASIVPHLVLEAFNFRIWEVHDHHMGRLPEGELLKLRLDVVPLKNSSLVMDLHSRMKLLRGIEGRLSAVDDEWRDHKCYTNEEIA